MATNVLQKNQTYPELGYRIDGRGVAYDLQTNQSLSRQDVDARIAALEDQDPTTDDYAARDRQRGGVGGVWDRNKKPLTTVAGIGAGLLATVLSGGTLGPAALAALTAGAGAGTNAAIKGFDREGKSGVGFDAKQAVNGLVPGAIQGYTGGKLATSLGADGASAGVDPTLANPSITTPGVADATVSATKPGLVSTATDYLKSKIPAAVTNATKGLTAKDYLKTGADAVGAGLDYKAQQGKLAQQKAEFERTQGRLDATTAVGAQDRLNRAPMADNAQALLMARMKQAPTTFAPRDFTKGPMTAQTMAAPATGGPADQMAAGRTAAANYTPGSGGVDTSVLEMLKRKMLASSGMRA